MKRWTSRTTTRVGAAIVALALLTGSGALAQQPAPQPPPPGGMPGIPAGHPAVPPPGGFAPPGAPPGARPLRPPAANPHGSPAGSPGGRAASSGHEAKPGGHCPGHGPLDAPHAPNWWHGMLMVNNERAKQGGFVNTLLFRYQNEADPCDEKNEPPPFLASLLNFGLLAFIVARFGRRPLAEALMKRKQSIMHEIDNATRLREEAEERLQTYEDKFETMEETLESLKAELALQAEVEKKHLLTEAEEQRARMKRDAEFRIEQELKAAKADLLQIAVQNAVLAAEELLKKSASAQDQDRMTREYLTAIPEALKGSASPSGLAGGLS